MAEQLNNEREVLSMRAALLLCEEKGKPFSKMGLYTTGLRHGFHKPGQKYDKELLEAYLATVLTAPPEGWKSLKEAADIVGCSLNTVYWWCSHDRVKSEMYGGIKYVEVEELRQYVNGANTGSDHE